MKEFKGLVFLGEGKYELQDKKLSGELGDNHVLLEVEAAGLCGTDIHILSVPPGHPATKGIVLGHEYTGKILEIGKDVKHVKPGDRVVVDPNITCGHCYFCRKGDSNLCLNMTTLGIFKDGGFAKYNIAESKSVYKIPETLPPEIAVFAEPLSCIVNGINKLKLTPGESVCVLGAGPMGLLFTGLLKQAGASPVIVSEPYSFRHEYAKKMGADYIVNPEDLEQKVKELTGHGVDIVVDAVGILLQQALNIVKSKGRVLLLGMNETAVNKVCQYYITRKEIHILGSFISHYSFLQTIEILNQGILDVKSLITHTLSLAKINEGIEAMRARKAIKVVIREFE